MRRRENLLLSKCVRSFGGLLPIPELSPFSSSLSGTVGFLALLRHIESMSTGNLDIWKEKLSVQHPPAEESSKGDVPGFQRIVILVTEAKAAARTLYELFPDRTAIEPLYTYLDEALHEVLCELTREGERRY